MTMHAYWLKILLAKRKKIITVNLDSDWFYFICWIKEKEYANTAYVETDIFTALLAMEKKSNLLDLDISIKFYYMQLMLMAFSPMTFAWGWQLSPLQPVRWSGRLAEVRRWHHCSLSPSMPGVQASVQAGAEGLSLWLGPAGAAGHYVGWKHNFVPAAVISVWRPKFWIEPLAGNGFLGLHPP